MNKDCDNPPRTYCDASVNLYLSQPAACTTIRRRQNRTVYAVLNLKHNLRSTYCSEANDRHEASRGLFATAELLVKLATVTYKARLFGLPAYLQCEIHHYHPSRTLCSTSALLLQQQPASRVFRISQRGQSLPFPSRPSLPSLLFPFPSPPFSPPLLRSRPY